MLNVQTLRRTLEVLTTAIVFAVSVVVLSISLSTYFRGGARDIKRLGLRNGEVLGHLEDYQLRGSTKTLIVAIETTCEICTRSISFYKRLSEITQSEKPDTKVIAVFPDSNEQVKQFVQQQRLSIDVISYVDLKGLRISAVPTIVLVDSNGRVLNFWIGQLSEQDQEDIIKSL